MKKLVLIVTLGVLLVLIVTLGVLLMGCEPSASVVNYPKAVGFEDCKFARLSDGNTSITVGRCPNSTTTTKTHEKYPKTTVIIDGDEYVKKEPETNLQ